MATPVDTLLVRIEADMAGLRRDLNNVQKQTGKTAGAFRSLGRVIAGALSVAAGIKIVNTIRQFEDLQATLVSVTGSAELASISFDLIRKFTAQTTFQLEQTTGAFITLTNAGIAPTSDVLKDVGNLAAAMGKDIREVAQAIFNATTGEMEMLKQLGIIARVEGENLAVTYKGVTETIDRSGDAIVDYIRTLSQENFPDAIEARANTLSGAISNLGDQISEFFMAIGEGGFKSALTDLVRTFSNLLESLRPLAQLLGTVLGAALTGLNAILIAVSSNTEALTAALVAMLASLAVSKIAAAGGAMIAFSKASLAAAAAVKALNTRLKANLLGLLATGVAFGTVKLLEFTGAMGGAEDATKDAEEAMRAANEAIEEGIAVDRADTGVEKLNKRIQELGTEVTAARLEVSGLNSEFAKTVAEAFPGMDNLAMIRQLGPEVSETLDLLISRQQALNAEQEKLARIDAGVKLAEQRTEAEELSDSLRDLEVAYRNGAISQNEFQSATEDLDHQLQMTKPSFEMVFNALESAGQKVSDSIAESLMKMEFSLSSFADIAQQIVQQIISQFIRMAIVNQALNAIFPGANLATIPLGRATGGNVNPRQPYIVGERGPEVFIPSSAGSIQNSNQTRSMSGGGEPIVVNQTLQVETGVSQTVRAEMMQMMPAIKQDTLNAVVDARRRGGRFSSAFGS